jgi:transcriptional regulator with XRE-family HTH domain
MKNYKDIGDRLEKVRLAYGISQAEFARRIGVKSHTYNGWLTGEKRPSVDTAIDICEAFDLTLDYLYRGKARTLSVQLEHAIRYGKRLDDV